MAIKAMPLAMMDAASGQMTDPPDGQKQTQQEPIQACPVTDPTGFQLPAATLGILKSRLDAHAEPIAADPSPARRLIRDEQPGFLVPDFPDGTQGRFDGAVLPEQDPSKPVLAMPRR